MSRLNRCHDLRVPAVGVVADAADHADAAQRHAAAEHVGNRREPPWERVRVARVGHRRAAAARRFPAAARGPTRSLFVSRTARRAQPSCASPDGGERPRVAIRAERLVVDSAVARPASRSRTRRILERRDRRLCRRQRRPKPLAHRQPLERVVRLAVDVEVAAEPAEAVLVVELADLPEVLRGEVRLVRVLVADSRHHGELALPVQLLQAGRRGVPLKARVVLVAVGGVP